MKHIKYLSIILTFTFAFMQEVNLQITDYSDGIIELSMQNSEPVSGIQFDVSSLLTFYAFSVYTVSLAAVLGGVLLGMFIATRTLSTQGFTPFEVSMLRLRDDIHNLNKEIKSIKEYIENFEDKNSK